ncbi:MAG: branched-chain alpha-keto acid dehydrogenase subunit E2 [Gammaproteobacteria bacterium RIFCSPHIGHO2_12_FULL_37_34]|nr:MAG: branched-chain alpha-keto acid dehydrogenase subunit E2 [Gammaproteobacteria bacterium RIFCSPHIGHO2_12_FULL_37_34]
MKIFNLPDLGEGLAEAEIREWYVKEGDMVTIDQPLVSMETAKAVVDVPSPYAGKIVKLHGKANDVIQTGAPFISFELTGSAADASKGSVVGSLEESSKKWDEGDVIVGAAKTKSITIKAMPAARVLANQMNVDLSRVTASGPQGLITSDDVKRYLEQSMKSTVPKGEALHGVRRVMATIMMQSHQEVVPVSIMEDADVTNLPRQANMTVHLLKAMVAAVKMEPSLNAWFDGKTLKRQLFDHVDIGLAVDTAEGLFVPVLRGAEQCSEEELRQKIDAYKEAVQHRTIASGDMQDATITLSNFGMIAGRYATPIIVPPMVAILGCGRSRDEVVAYNGEMAIRRIVPLSLTVDHRAVTGGEAARFLGAVVKYLEDVIK